MRQLILCLSQGLAKLIYFWKSDPVKVNKKESIKLTVSNIVPAEINTANISDNFQPPKITLNNIEPWIFKTSCQQTNACVAYATPIHSSINHWH